MKSPRLLSIGKYSNCSSQGTKLQRKNTKIQMMKIFCMAKMIGIARMIGKDMKGVLSKLLVLSLRNNHQIIMGQSRLMLVLMQMYIKKDPYIQNKVKHLNHHKIRVQRVPIMLRRRRH
jgi:hypothetical protein